MALKSGNSALLIFTLLPYILLSHPSNVPPGGDARMSRHIAFRPLQRSGKDFESPPSLQHNKKEETNKFCGEMLLLFSPPPAPPRIHTHSLLSRSISFHPRGDET